MFCFISVTVGLRYDTGGSSCSSFVGKHFTSKKSPARQLCPSRNSVGPRSCMRSTDFPPEQPGQNRASFVPGQQDISDADFEAQVEQLSREVSALPSGYDGADVRSMMQEEERKEKLRPQEILRTVALTADAVNSDTEDLWIEDQSALLSVVEEDLDPSEDSFSDANAVADAVFSLTDYGDASETQITYTEANSSIDSRRAGHDGLNDLDRREKIERRRKTVQRRRKSLSVESDENDMLGYVSRSEREADVNGPLRDVLRKVARQGIRHRSSFSLSRARVIDLDNQSDSDHPNALTNSAKKLITEASRCPFSFGPLTYLQDAFERKDSPACIKCGGMMDVSSELDTGSICQNCYRKAYLQPPAPVRFDESNSWEYEEGSAERQYTSQPSEAESLRFANAKATKPASNLFGMGHVSMNARETKSIRRSIEKSTPNAKSGVYGSHKSSNGSGNYGGTSPPGFDAALADGWNVQASSRSLNTINPIRNLVQNITVEPNPNKKVIKLSVGDPTVYGNLRVSEKAISGYCEVMRSGRGHGYSMSMGSEEARRAVAERYTSPKSPLTPDDVILTSGTSGAIELAFGAIANAGDNVLLPSPGFPLFRTIAAVFDIECRYYRIDPNKNWEIVLDDIHDIADERTAAIVVNNPSNPCGSVYSMKHIDDLLATASKLKLPVIADEVYADMVFPGREFESIGSRSVDVPVLCLGGMSKQFVAPGWRLGWMLIHDRNRIFETGGVRKGLRQLTTRMLVPNTPAQEVLPLLLEEGTSDPAFKAVMNELEKNALFTVKSLQNAKGLRVIEPQGSMYVMAEIDVNLLGLRDDMEFTEKLLEEESVFVLPGQCFKAPNFVRIVFAAPREVLSEAFFRIRSFCSRHSGGM